MKIIETEYRGMLILAPDDYCASPDEKNAAKQGNMILPAANTAPKEIHADTPEELLEQWGVCVNFGWETEIRPAGKDILSGLHFQISPEAQTMLVRCESGAVTYYAVDLRRGSDTFSEYFPIELSEENKIQLFIPAGFAHGFFTLTENVLLCQRVDKPDSPEHKRIISFYDLQFQFRFQTQIRIRPVEDEQAVTFSQSDADFSIKALVIGATGLLGYEVLRYLKEYGIEAIGTSRRDFDITNREQTEKFIQDYRPDVVINCAAYTAVDEAEDEEELCFAVNAEGAANVARICSMIDAKMLYVSTDYVFDGEGQLIQQVEKPVSPINTYGRSKVAGEQLIRDILEKHFIVRTSWLYGINGDDFVKKILRKIDAGQPLHVVTDQIGAPTYAIDLARLIVNMIQTVYYGTYHATNMKNCSRYEFAQAILRKSGIKAEVIPVLSADYPTKAKRPNNSRISKDKLKLKGFARMPTWQNAIGRYLQELRQDPEFAHMFPEPEISERERRLQADFDEKMRKARKILEEISLKEKMNEESKAEGGRSETTS